MMHAEEAMLDLLATADTRGETWFAADFPNDERVQNLLQEGMVEIVDGKLLVSAEGQRLLASRPVENPK